LRPQSNLSTISRRQIWRLLWKQLVAGATLLLFGSRPYSWIFEAALQNRH
jgi:bifunctional non-homologous end joining protein LigD